MKKKVSKKTGFDYCKDVQAFIRQIVSQYPKPISWRDRVPYLVASDLDYDSNSSTLKVTGYIRGGNLSANRLVHIPNYGDFQVSQILEAPLPRDGEVVMDEPTVLHRPDPELQV